MTVGLLLSLTGLALVDSTSIGTLFIPIWLLLTPGRIRVDRILVYLVTIAAFYFVVGTVVMLGAHGIGSLLQDARHSPVVLWGQFALGLGLLVFSWTPRFDPKRARQKSGPSRTARWRERAMSDSSALWLGGLALLAALAEVATMLPYLAAIGVLTASGLSTAVALVLLACYCVVMVLPGIALLLARIASRAHVEPLLQRLDHWISTKGVGAMGWIIGIVGFLVAQDAFVRIWFTGS